MKTELIVGEALLAPREVAAMLCVDPKTVTRWAQAGRLRSFRTPGGHRRYRRSDVVALLSSLPYNGSNDAREADSRSLTDHPSVLSVVAANDPT